MLDKKINQIIEKVNQINNYSSDITNRTIKVKGKEIGYIFLESTASDEKIGNIILENINLSKIHIYTNIYNYLKNNLKGAKINEITTYDDLFYHLASGYLCILTNNTKKIIAIETKANLDRSISESTTESVVRGSKDAFNENYNANIGLIRKRLKDSNLIIAEQKVGKRTKTKIGVMYLQDVAKIDNVNKIINKIKTIDIDGILDSGYIRDYLIKDTKSVFPLVVSTEKPDLVASTLLEGKIAILVENSPFMIILPATLMDFFHPTEDNYQKAINVSFSKVIRLIAFILTIVTPAIYIAITTYNVQVIPNELLTSISIQREGVPFTTAFEVLILLLTFEILRESDVRLPETLGNSISIVGVLVLGDAAVSAGIVSPIVIIVIGLTCITSLLFTDIDMVNAYRYWRLLFMAFAMIMGIYGFMIALFIFIIKLSSLESLDIPYLYPFVDNDKNIFSTLFQLPRTKSIKRSKKLSKNYYRSGDHNEN